MKTVHYLKHLLIGLVIIAALGVVVMLLWNWLIPSIFGWSTINCWQAFGLLALSRILVGGRGWRWRHHHHRRHDCSNPIREKWMKMSPEERKEFIKNFRNRREQMKGDWNMHNRFRDWNEFFEDSDSNPVSEKTNE